MKHAPFNNHYARLGEDFHTRPAPAAVPAPGLIIFNEALATRLQLDDTELAGENREAIYAGNLFPDGAEPIAMAYAGHQFGQFNPQLGDGRALLLGQVIGRDNKLYDIHLKGSGRTQFSRGGDGRSALGPVLREYLLCEAMHALGVPTTRALAAVTTGEQVARTGLLPGGVITRVARSFVRVGTFEYFASRNKPDCVRQLADYVIEHNYPACLDNEQPYRALLATVIDRQARLIAQWMQLGFIHGVMNTDNMSIAGETIDYGPCAFMDHYRHEQVYSSIDHQGRYAYNNQPNIGLWNLTRFAETLLPLLADDSDAAIELAKDALGRYADRYSAAWLDGMRAKLGLATAQDEDRTLVTDLLEVMHGSHADFTVTFRNLAELGPDADERDDSIRDHFADRDAIDAWLVRWRARLQLENSDFNIRRENMQRTNPLYIPRNHQVEAAIRAAEDQDDFSVFHALLAVLQDPCTYQRGKERFTLPPEPDQVVHQTFCGT